MHNKCISYTWFFFSFFRHLNFFDIVRLDDEKELSKRYGMVNIKSSFDLCFGDIFFSLVFFFLHKFSK